MNKQIPNYLRLVTDNTAGPAPQSEDLSCLAAVANAFEQATGWRLEFDDEPTTRVKPNLMWSAPVNPGVGASPGHIRLFSTERRKAAIPLAAAGKLAGSVAELWSELLGTRHALRQREAELATGVPLSLRADQALALPDRLEAVLRAGAEAVDCQAAALYLLDDATTELKLRASWGLPRGRLIEPARPLRGALADLEALLGHAVVLSEQSLFDYWVVPERGFAACVCVPVSSASTPLGTLWVFSTTPRDFTDAQTNVVEVIAGRLASDLEREVLVEESLARRQQPKHIAAVDYTLAAPRVSPLIEGWDIAARADHAGSLGGTFYDWFARDDGSLAVVAAEAQSAGTSGALTAAALRATSRAIGPQPKPAPWLLDRANTILWTGSSGGESASMFQAVVSEQSSAFQFASAGPLRVLNVRGDAARACKSSSSLLLGAQEELLLQQTTAEARPGDLLIVYNTGYLRDADELILAALDQRLSLSLEPCLDLPAAQLVDIAGQVLAEQPAVPNRDRVLVLIKRRKSAGKARRRTQP